MGPDDEPLGEEQVFLGSSADIGIYETAALLRAYGGVAIPAHVDRASFSLLSNLGFYDSAMDFTAAELSAESDPDAFLSGEPAMRGLHILQNSDAHDLGSIPDAKHTLQVSEKTAKAVVAALSKAKTDDR
jgi:PHP family Zn ribbon phosphoesterase